MDYYGCIVCGEVKRGIWDFDFGTCNICEKWACDDCSSIILDLYCTKCDTWVSSDDEKSNKPTIKTCKGQDLCKEFVEEGELYRECNKCVESKTMSKIPIELLNKLLEVVGCKNVEEAMKLLKEGRLAPNNMIQHSPKKRQRPEF